MKLVIAIVNPDDVARVTEQLVRSGFSATCMATTGGFLRSDNATVFVGVDEEKVQAVVDVIKSEVHARRQTLPAGADAPFGYPAGVPVEITVAGATIFVVDIEQFQRV